MQNDWDRLYFNYNGVKSLAHDGWYDKVEDRWPISPVCRKRWLPKLTELIYVCYVTYIKHKRS